MSERAVETARAVPEERASAGFLALEEDLEREHARAAQSLAEIETRLEQKRELSAPEREPIAEREQVAAGREREIERERLAASEAAEEAKRRLTEIATQIEAAGERVKGAEARLREESARLRQEVERRVEQEAERIRAAAQEKLEIELAEEAARAHLDAEVDARSAAAEWLRSQRKAIEREATREAEASVAERGAAPVAAEPDQAGSALRAGERAAGYREISERIDPVSAEPKKPGAGKRPTARSAVETGVVPAGPMINANEATFEQLRQLGMSVTQATRVIAYRERQDGFDSTDDLDRLPGFPKAFLAEVKQRLEI